MIPLHLRCPWSWDTHPSIFSQPPLFQAKPFWLSFAQGFWASVSSPPRLCVSLQWFLTALGHWEVPQVSVWAMLCAAASPRHPLMMDSHESLWWPSPGTWVYDVPEGPSLWCCTDQGSEHITLAMPLGLDQSKVPLSWSLYPGLCSLQFVPAWPQPHAELSKSWPSQL